MRKGSQQEGRQDLDVAHDPEINFISPLEIWDTHYLRLIDDSGFIENLH